MSAIITQFKPLSIEALKRLNAIRGMSNPLIKSCFEKGNQLDITPTNIKIINEASAIE